MKDSTEEISIDFLFNTFQESKIPIEKMEWVIDKKDFKKIRTMKYSWGHYCWILEFPEYNILADKLEEPKICKTFLLGISIRVENTKRKPYISTKLQLWMFKL